jgi:cell division protein FtsZ
MGSYAADGEDRAAKAVQGALSSPLLKDNEIEGASYILLNISSGTKEVTMDEVSIITNFIQEKSGVDADVIWGNCSDENLGEKISVTIIATGFQTKEEREITKQSVPVKQYLNSETPLTRPINEIINTTVKQQEIAEPELKREGKLQPDLFGQIFASSDKNVVSESRFNTEEVIKHQLIEEEKVEEIEVEKPEFTFDVKIAESEFSTPVYEIEPEEITEQEDVDAHKTDESMDEQLRKSKERILRLKDLSMKLRTSNGLQEMENEPAYKRKHMQMNDVAHSSESHVSRFTLSVEEGKTEIRPNNSFLHDNVD